ncbi:MAG: transposase [Candidatus Bathyarchaeota archaeon]|nr:transposase [Candidatus Termiticorpusculum sp.]
MLNPNLSQYKIDEVEKMLHCRDPKYGFLTYKCPECDTIKTVPLACKSRICPQCGKKYADKWADELTEKLFAVPHRHMVFTMPEELRAFVLVDQSLFKILMDAVSNTLQQMVKDKRGAVPGVVCVLHPYGKELNLNPPVHVLLTEGGLTKAGEWVPVSYLEYNSLRRVWQYQLLTMVKRVLPRSVEINRLVNRLFVEYRDGFYVYGKRRVSSPRQIAGYVGCYLCHPVVAESRISEFNLESNMVTFWFFDENKVKRFVTLPALEFIGRLVRLIPDKNLKLIRYYGLYSRRTSGRLQKVLTCLSRENVFAKFKKMVVCCLNCGKGMDLLGVTRLDGDGGLVYEAWHGEGDDDCW